MRHHLQKGVHNLKCCSISSPISMRGYNLLEKIDRHALLRFVEQRTGYILRRDSNKFKECCCLSGRTNIAHSNQYCHVVDICILFLTTVSIAKINLRASNGNRPTTASFAARHHAMAKIR